MFYLYSSFKRLLTKSEDVRPLIERLEHLKALREMQARPTPLWMWEHHEYLWWKHVKRFNERAREGDA